MFSLSLSNDYVTYSVYSRKENKQVSAFKIQYIYINRPSVNIVWSYTWGKKTFPNAVINIYLCNIH